jgi:hypothetical protein
MTTYGAYDHGLPCKNPSCGSYGSPHPNCRCYGNMAEGGEAKPFCSENRMHQPDCQYFADGGAPDTGPQSGDEVPPDLAAPAPASEPAAGDEVPDELAMPATAAPAETGPPAPTPQAGDEVPPDLATEAPAPARKMPWETSYGDDYQPTDFEKSLLPTALALPVAGPAAEAIMGTAARLLPGLDFSTATGKLMGHLVETGANAIKGAISNGLIQGADELSKSLLGQGNPEHAVGALVSAAGLGFLFGAGGSAIGQGAKAGIEKVAETKTAGKLASTLMGIGRAAQIAPDARADADAVFQTTHDQILGPMGGDWKSYQKGQKIFDESMAGGVSKAVNTMTMLAGAGAGGVAHGITGSLEGSALGWAAGKILGPVTQWMAKSTAQKIIPPITAKILSSGTTAGIVDVLQNAEKMANGYNMVARGTDALFKTGSNAAIDAYLSPTAHKQWDSFVGSGGENEAIQQQVYQDNAAPQGFAEGGAVKMPEAKSDIKPVLDQPHGFALHYPEQNMLLQTAKGRISNYLQGLRPGGAQPKLAFDDEPETAEQKRSYDRALNIAAKPLGVLEEVRKGTLEPEHLTHLSALHPEALSLMRKTITDRITEAQLKGEKPPHHIRQGLSDLLGVPLGSEFTPSGIQGAQRAFASAQSSPAPSAGQAPTKAKHQTAPLSKSDQSYLTGSQAREAREQKV